MTVAEKSRGASGLCGAIHGDCCSPCSSLGSHPGLPPIVGNPIPLQEYICSGGLYQYHNHCGCTALTIATIPAFTAVGRRSHACTTVARSSGTLCTHSAHFSCKNMSLRCVECVSECGDSLMGESPNCIDL